MKYVKLTAKPDTWFKEGTEVYDYDCDPPNTLFRITLEVWESHVNFQGIKAILARGIRKPQLQREIEIFGEGERWDGEFCGIDEFEVEIVDDPR
jgi:hypothetical protein